jgi:sulfur carrier protein
MNIQLNGNPHEIDSEMSVFDFLASIGFGGKPCVVELDEEAVFPRDYATRLIGEGSRVEIVTLAAGG